MLSGKIPKGIFKVEASSNENECFKEVNCNDILRELFKFMNDLPLVKN